MSQAVIDECCANIIKNNTNISDEQLTLALDIFNRELTATATLDEQYVFVDQIASALTKLPTRSKQLTTTDLIQHEFFPLLRDTIIINHFRHRKLETYQTKEVLLHVCNLFMDLYYNVNDSNSKSLKPLLFHQPLIEEMSSCLTDMQRSGQYFTDTILCQSISCLLTALKHYQAKLIITDEYSLSTPVFSAVSQCLSSSYAIAMIRNLKHNFTQKVDHLQSLFLDTMPLYLQWYSDYHELKHFHEVLRNILSEYTKWFTGCPPKAYLECTTEMGALTRHLNYFLVRPIESDDLNVFSDAFYTEYSRLVSQWIFILSSTLACPADQMNISSTRTVAEMLYNFTLHLNVLNHMKTNSDLIPMLLKLTEIDHDEVQLNAYRCLGKLMREEDIKTIANPSKIASVYVDFMTRFIDDRQQIRRFYSILDSLRNFVQHDQLKVELIRQGALPLLTKCVMGARYDPIKIQSVALEILLSLSFNNDACIAMRTNQNFIKHIRSLSHKTSSNTTELQRPAESLLWKLEKEEAAVAKSSNFSSYQYDIMISYSHKEEEICLQIYDALVTDGYRVWLDLYCLRGPTMIGIANAIENSEYVLINMSNAYKQSAYCQSEAHYAFERGCRLIPIIIEPNYKPDGWLGIIVCGKTYVDFGRLQFPTAYQKLKNEISERRYETFSRQLSRSKEKEQNSISSQNMTAFRRISNSIGELPMSIHDWSHEHVRWFLLQKELDKTIYPLCHRVDGPRLLALYEMCLMNRESMYQSLKFELNVRHQSLLPIGDYLTFLHEVKLFITTGTSFTSSDTRQNQETVSIQHQPCSLI